MFCSAICRPNEAWQQRQQNKRCKNAVWSVIFTAGHFWCSCRSVSISFKWVVKTVGGTHKTAHKCRTNFKININTNDDEYFEWILWLNLNVNERKNWTQIKFCKGKKRTCLNFLGSRRMHSIKVETTKKNERQHRILIQSKFSRGSVLWAFLICQKWGTKKEKKKFEWMKLRAKRKKNAHFGCSVNDILLSSKALTMAIVSPIQFYNLQFSAAWNAPQGKRYQQKATLENKAKKKHKTK